MKTLIAHIVKLRNPAFTISNETSSAMLVQFVTESILMLIRGWKVVFYFRSPNFLLCGKSVSFKNMNSITWGRFLKLGDSVHISAWGRPGVHIGKQVSIGAFSRLVVSTSLQHPGKGILIGNQVGIGEFAYIGGGGGVKIGSNCIIGQYFSCHPENHQYSDPDCIIRLQGVTRKGIEIGENCWIGAKVTILDGVKIGNNCVIAAGAVVTRSFSDNTLIAGVPARAIKSTSKPYTE